MPKPSYGGPTPSFSLYLDRIEGEIAVLICGEEPPFFFWNVPCNLLPQGARAGERLACLLRRDPQATTEAAAQNRALRESLPSPSNNENA